MSPPSALAEVGACPGPPLLSVRLPLSARLGAPAASAQRAHARVLERLASGTRVVRAADDAAGMGVSSSLRADVRSLMRARLNVEDAWHATTIAESGIAEITDLLQRMRELAVASSSDTLSDEERAYLQMEYGELLDEVDRTSRVTEYNGTKLLTPSMADILVLLDQSNSMAAEIAAIKPELPILRATLEARGMNVQMGIGGVSDTNDALDGSSMILPLTADGAQFDAVMAGVTTTGPGLMDPYTVMLDQTGIVPVTGTDGPEQHFFRGGAQRSIIYLTDTGRETALSANNEASTAALLAAEGFRMYITTIAIRLPQFDDIVAATGGLLAELDPAGAVIPTIFAQMADDIINGAGDATALTVQAGIHNTVHDTIELGFPLNTTTNGLGLDASTIAAAVDARDALDLIDAAIEDVSGMAAQLGANMNRLEAAGRHIDAQVQALSGAEGQIRDADMADTASQATARQIIQQASVAALMQARQLDAAAIPALLG